MNYAAHFRTLYRLWGVDAELAIDSNTYTVRVIDKTAGVEAVDMNGVATIRPAAQVRVSDLGAASIARGDLSGSMIEMNGKTWRIEGTAPMPTTRGEGQGQLLLYLFEAS